MLLSAGNVVVRVFLAPGCAACDGLLMRPLDSPVCPACWRGIAGLSPPLCAQCGDALNAWRDADPRCARCRRQPPVYALARSAGRYEGSLRTIVHAFKYQRRRLLAAPLGALMREAGADLLAGADAVVPVPLHLVRSLERGFNQADDLCCALRLPVWRVLRRTRHGPPQAGLPAARRHGNVRDAFGLRWGAGHRGLRNTAVVLVDDVMTTGATVNACARVLLEAGVRSVGVLTAARAATPRPAAPHGPQPLSAAPHR
jgi:ComF family protein